MEEMNKEVIDVIDTQEEIAEDILDTENTAEEVETEETSGYSVVEKIIGTIVTAGVTYVVYRIGKKVVLKVQSKTEKAPKKHFQMPFEFKWKGFFKEEPYVDKKTDDVKDNKDNSTEEA